MHYVYSIYLFIYYSVNKKDWCPLSPVSDGYGCLDRQSAVRLQPSSCCPPSCLSSNQQITHNDAIFPCDQNVFRFVACCLAIRIDNVPLHFFKLYNILIFLQRGRVRDHNFNKPDVGPLQHALHVSTVPPPPPIHINPKSLNPDHYLPIITQEDAYN